MLNNKEYKQWVNDLKSRIRQSQIKATVRVNTALIELYWNIGAEIVAKQAENGWGSNVIYNLSTDLRKEFPTIHGFSERNLLSMKQFYLFYESRNLKSHQAGAENSLVALSGIDKRSDEATITRNTQLLQHDNVIWPQVVAKSSVVTSSGIDKRSDEMTIPRNTQSLQDDNAIPQQVVAESSLVTSSEIDNDVAIWPQLVAKIPWGHHIEIISKCKTIEEASFYLQKTADEGWSRATLLSKLKKNLFKTQGKAVTNFSTKLPAHQSELASEILKDPYSFDFLTMTESYKERELEDALTDNITKFLLELGKGFAFAGRQVELKVGNESYFVDMLFYHIKLKCYVVVELKTVKFEPEFAGKLNFYVTAIDRQLRDENDNSTIGLIICKSKDDVVAEYALADVNKPLGISAYDLRKVLPKKFKSALPSIEEIEARFNK